MDSDHDMFEDEEESGAGHNIPIWLITLADMSMLLMSFFIFMFALSNTNPTGVSDSLESMRKRLATDSGNLGPGRGSETDRAVRQASLREQLIQRQRQVYQEVNGYFLGQGETSMRTKLEGTRLIISMSSDGMFSKADITQLTDLGRQRLKTIADLIAKHPDQRVHIKGYTDDANPPPDSRFRNNWEVSSLQAVSALRYLMSLGVPSNRLTSTGLADLEPLLPNTSDENRARNRRLDFVFEAQVEG